MIVNCGRCGTQFQVPGEGRFSCPACGTANEVHRTAPPGPGGGPMSAPGGPGIPRPPAPEPPSPRTTCPDCAFSFIVGEISVATCPNCGLEVSTGRGEP